MIGSASQILFRASSNSHLMVEPREKSPFQKWESEKKVLDGWETEYALMPPEKSTQKKWMNLHSKIKQKRELVSELDAHKFDIHLAEGVITHLVDIYASFKYGRKEEAISKYLEKGHRREQRAITSVSRTLGVMLKKNSERLRNEYVQGEPDTFEGESIFNADITHDTKASWSLHTFLRAKHKDLDKSHEWQGHTYMWLTKAKQHQVHYCLENGTFEAIEAEKNKLRYVYGMYDEHGNPSDACKDRLRQIEINHIFDLGEFLMEHPHYDFDNDKNEWKWDIPRHERIHTKFLNREDSAIESLRNRIVVCRKWMDQNLFSVKTQ